MNDCFNNNALIKHEHIYLIILINCVSNKESYLTHFLNQLYHFHCYYYELKLVLKYICKLKHISIVIDIKCEHLLSIISQFKL